MLFKGVLFALIKQTVNYPFAKDKWAWGFTDLCFSKEVLFESPPVYSAVPDEVF